MLMYVTYLGEMVILGGLALGISGCLLLARLWRFSATVLLSFLLPAAAITVTKLVFYTCDITHGDIASPSGHAAVSLSVYGMIALVAAKMSCGLWRVAILLPAIGLITLICASRVILGMHSTGDVMVGALVGLISLLVIYFAFLFSGSKRSANAAPPENVAGTPPLRRKGQGCMLTVFFILVVTIIIICYGIKLPSDRTVRQMSGVLKPYAGLCNL